MARYTGPSYKRSRRVGMSLSETGRELAKDLMDQDNTEMQDMVNQVIMVIN